MLSHNIRPFNNNPKGNGLTQTLVLVLTLFVSSAVVLGTVPLFEPPYASPIHELLHSIDHVLRWEFYAVGLLIGIALATLRQHSLLGA